MNILTWPWRSLRAQLLMLQLENYELHRAVLLMLRAALRPPRQTRKDIVWTNKLRLLVLLSVVMLAAAGYVVSGFQMLGIVVALLLFTPLATLLLVLSLLLLWPVDWLTKMIIVARARRTLASRKDLVVIGIGGSYGKTTVKEALRLTLGQSKNVLATPGNINTPLGIARLILRDLLPETQVFIVEMGAHYPGDIAALMRLCRPQIVVENGINETHLERFGGWERAIAAECELLSELAPDGVAILNIDDPVVCENYETFLGGQQQLTYSARVGAEATCAPTMTSFHRDSLTRTVTLPAVGEVHVQLLPAYAAGTAAAAVLVAQQLGVSMADIRRGLGYMPPVEHRLQAIRNDAADILVIDDSYNGNTAGVREALALLAEFPDRRRVYVTPGLVELGDASDEIHHEIGQWLAQADLEKLVLVNTSATRSIAAGLTAAGFPTERVTTQPTAQAAHAYVQRTARRGDVILFQNDWPDNYQ